MLWGLVGVAALSYRGTDALGTGGSGYDVTSEAPRSSTDVTAAHLKM